MHYYIKPLFSIAAVIVLVLSLAGCGQEGNGGDPSSSENSGLVDEGPLELTQQEELIQYVQPYLGIVHVDQFNSSAVLEPDALVNLYFNSNAYQGGLTQVDAQTLAAFIEGIFPDQVGSLTSSSYYNAESNIYIAPENIYADTPVSLELNSISTEGDVVSLEFEYTSKNDEGFTIRYLYALKVSLAEEGFQYVAGKNLLTEFKGDAQ